MPSYRNESRLLTEQIHLDTSFAHPEPDTLAEHDVMPGIFSSSERKINDDE